MAVQRYLRIGQKLQVTGRNGWGRISSIVTMDACIRDQEVDVNVKDIVLVGLSFPDDSRQAGCRLDALGPRDADGRFEFLMLGSGRHEGVYRPLKLQESGIKLEEMKPPAGSWVRF
jgi:hypothetical protein